MQANLDRRSWELLLLLQAGWVVAYWLWLAACPICSPRVQMSYKYRTGCLALFLLPHLPDVYPRPHLAALQHGPLDIAARQRGDRR